MDLESIMDINEVGVFSFQGRVIPAQVEGFFQIQMYLTMRWFESRLRFQVEPPHTSCLFARTSRMTSTSTTSYQAR